MATYCGCVRLENDLVVLMSSVVPVDCICMEMELLVITSCLHNASDFVLHKCLSDCQHKGP